MKTFIALFGMTSLFWSAILSSVESIALIDLDRCIKQSKLAQEQSDREAKINEEYTQILLPIKDEIDNLEKEFTEARNAGALSEEGEREKLQVIEEKKRYFEQKITEVQGKFFETEEQSIREIQEKIQLAIAAVRKEKSFSCVLNRDPRIVIYHENEEEADITDLVIYELNQNAFSPAEVE